MIDPQPKRRVLCRRKPTRAAIARANGARSRGPVSEAGRRRSSMNALVHGLRARRYVPVEALGESAAECRAHFAAVRAELGAEAGPIARHLAESAAACLLRAARAERLEGELLAGLALGGHGIAKALHADREARATLALLLRYRREADGELRRSLDALARLRRAQAEGLLPDDDAPARADAALATVADDPCEPNEPRIEKIEPPQPRTAASAPLPPPSAEELLEAYRLLSELNPQNGRDFWQRCSPEERAAMRALEPEAGDLQGIPRQAA